MTTDAQVLEDFLLDVFSEGDEIRVALANGDEFLSTDVEEVVAACMDGIADDPWIDLVDQFGKAHGIFLPGDPTSVDPAPTYVVDQGMIFVLDIDQRLLDCKRREHMLPVNTILDDKPAFFYMTDELRIATTGGEMPITLSQGRNRQERQGDWKPVKSFFGQFADALRNHVEGKKDGPCFLQGECAGGNRKASAMIANHIIGIDLDSGAPLDGVMESIVDAGLEAVIYTTHSHLKATSTIKRDAFVKWSGVMEATPELCATYLQQVKGTLPAITEGLTIIDKGRHDPEGVVIVVQHQPMPKFRVVFPLAEPFIFAERGGIQQDAIAEWKERYAAFSQSLGFFYDESCVDPARLFYLPRHPKGAVFDTRWIAGNPVELNKYDRVKIKRKSRGKMVVEDNAFTAFAGGADAESDAERYKIGQFNLVWWAKDYAKLFEAEDFLTEFVPDALREPRGSGKSGIHVECPFEAEHSDMGGGGTFVVNSSGSAEEGYDSGFAFKCVHDACQGRDRLDFLKGCIEQDWFTAEDLTRKEFLVQLEEEEPEKDWKTEVYQQGKANSLTEEEELFEYFNARFAVVLNGSDAKILYEPKADGLKDDISFLTQASVALIEANKMIVYQGKNNKEERVSAFKKWLEWEGRRTYRSVVFAPGAEPRPDVYNLFSGFARQPVKGDWSKLRTHIYENMCESDDKLFDWVMTWMAQLIQEPWKKPGSALVIIGDKGSGKTTMLEMLTEIIGKYALSSSQREHLIGKFNKHLGEALLMVCEESFWHGDPSADGVIKDLITNKWAMIEKKGYDTFKSRSVTRVVVLTNHEHAVQASFDERRYCVLRCSNARNGDLDFWGELQDQMYKEGGLEAMMYELLHYKPKTGDFKILYTPPITAPLQDQQVASLNGVDRFMYDLLRTGLYEPSDDNKDAIELNETRETHVTCKDLRRAVEDYVKANFASVKAKVRYEDITPGVEEWFGAVEKKVRSETASNQTRIIVFPSLKDARDSLHERRPTIKMEYMETEEVEPVRRR
jgi:hypothetical protein